MSKAYKCDRCGEYYSKDERAERYLIEDCNKPSNNRFIDLCDRCYEMLEKFVEGEVFYCEMTKIPLVDPEIAAKIEDERQKLDFNRALTERWGVE